VLRYYVSYGPTSLPRFFITISFSIFYAIEGFSFRTSLYADIERILFDSRREIKELIKIKLSIVVNCDHGAVTSFHYTLRCMRVHVLCPILFRQTNLGMSNACNQMAFVY
jgi:hypothetical protein